MAVSVVGKYRYHMLSPHEHNQVPVLVDIILVGRTKIITLHSSIWIDNRTDKDLSFRLHVPVTPLTAPAVGSSGKRSDTIIGPVQPEKGVQVAFEPPPVYLLSRPALQHCHGMADACHGIRTVVSLVALARGSLIHQNDGYC